MSAVDINKDPLLERYHGARGFSTIVNKLPANRGAEVPNCDVRSHANLFSRSYKAERRLSYEPNSPEQFLALLYGVHLCFVLFRSKTRVGYRNPSLAHEGRIHRFLAQETTPPGPWGGMLQLDSLGKWSLRLTAWEFRI